MSRAAIAMFARFGLVGVLATGTHLVVVALLALLTAVEPLAANTIGFLVAFIVSGFGHARYTFRLKRARGRALAKWFIISLAGLAASNLVLAWLLANPPAPDIWLRVGATAVVPAASYLAARLWAFVE